MLAAVLTATIASRTARARVVPLSHLTSRRPPRSLLKHLANVGPSLPDLIAVAPITRFEVFGDVSAQARTALDGLGAKHFDHLVGFER